MKSHQQLQQPSTCGQCGKIFSRPDNLSKHLRHCTGHKQLPPPPPEQQQQQTTTTTTTTRTTTTTNNYHHHHHQNNNNNRQLHHHHHQSSPSAINIRPWEVLWNATTSICRRHSTSTTYQPPSTSSNQP